MSGEQIGIIICELVAGLFILWMVSMVVEFACLLIDRYRWNNRRRK